MAKISLKQIQAFVTVADLGSFRRAAEKLLTTQPNISSRISGLEVQLGAKLMERDAGSVRMTATGELLLPRARDVLAALDGIKVTRLAQGLPAGGGLETADELTLYRALDGRKVL